MIFWFLTLLRLLGAVRRANTPDGSSRARVSRLAFLTRRLSTQTAAKRRKDTQDERVSAIISMQHRCAGAASTPGWQVRSPRLVLPQPWDAAARNLRCPSMTCSSQEGRKHRSVQAEAELRSCDSKYSTSDVDLATADPPPALCGTKALLSPGTH